MIESTVRVLKYKQVENEVRGLVARSVIGAKLPTERELAKMLGFNFLTVRKGLQPLVEDGILRRRAGSGTFVARKPANLLAHTRRAGTDTEPIGMLIHCGGDLYSYRVVQALAQSALMNSKVQLRSAWIQQFGAEAVQAVKDLAQSGCRAAILPWFPAGQDEQVRRFVRACPIPIVLPQVVGGLEHLCFEKVSTFGTSSSVEVEALCEYFLRLGSKRIHFIGPDQSASPTLQQRVTAYVCHAAKAGFEPSFGLMGPTAASATELAEREHKYAGELAVIAYDDAHAVRFMSAMHRLGLSAPRDYRIVGHNDTSTARNADPPLSTTRQNFEYIGRGLLHSATTAAHGALEQSQKSPSPRLVVRDSCGGRDVVAGMNIPGLEIQVEQALVAS